MLRITLVSIALLVATNISVSYAEKISTEKCDPPQSINETRTQGGKTYSCTSKTVCRTTTCETGGPAACTVTTETKRDCTEVAATGPQGNRGGVTAGGAGGVLDPGKSPTRRPKMTAPMGGAVLQRQ